MVRDGDELTAFVTRCLERPEYAAQLGARARQIVAAQRGATGQTLELLDGLRPSSDASGIAGANRRVA